MQGTHAAHFTTRARVSAAADVIPEWIFVKLPLPLWVYDRFFYFPVRVFFYSAWHRHQIQLSVSPLGDTGKPKLPKLPCGSSWTSIWCGTMPHYLKPLWQYIYPAVQEIGMPIKLDEIFIVSVYCDSSQHYPWWSQLFLIEQMALCWQMTTHNTPPPSPAMTTVCLPK